jgi:hypothetical protein
MRNLFSGRALIALAGLIVVGLTVAVPAVAAPPSRPAACSGSVEFPVPAGQSVPQRAPVCVTVGGVVRFEAIGSSPLTATPATAVDCFYAAGIRSCRLLRPGSVVFTWPVGPQSQRLAVTVADALPATACAGSGTTVRVSAADELPWWSPCLRVGATLRVEDLGPGALTVTPAAAVECHYEAGVHACLIVAAGTLGVVADEDGQRRVTSVVAIA